MIFFIYFNYKNNLETFNGISVKKFYDIFLNKIHTKTLAFKSFNILGDNK